MTTTGISAKARSLMGLIVERGLATEDQWRQLQRQCEQRRPPMGEVLLRKRVLTVSQVRRVLERQAEAPDMRFGEIAVAEGFIDCEAVRQALGDQRSAAPHPVELLAEQHQDDRTYLKAMIGALVEAQKTIESEVYALSLLLRAGC
ncbi:MAG: hypothetical protein Q9Q40_00055 [Acidobacteriota bacterium]|nr:hypothetical protein [Acidobacteriota bacterium]MDQ7088422.1 hypothetical protein [Acidobacteriota bacterium]